MDRVQQDGSMFLVTPVDPLFFIVPCLLEAGQLFRSLGDLINGEDSDVLHEHVCTLPGLFDALVSPALREHL